MAGQEGSPISFGTTVPLTQYGQNSILLAFEHCPTRGDRRKLIETMGRVSVYRFGTGSSTELLDIGVVKHRLAPGLILTSEAQCHANSQLYS
jgi:hypothetical protein